VGATIQRELLPAGARTRASSPSTRPLKKTHKALKNEGFSNREASWTHAEDVVKFCGIWLAFDGREKKRDAAVAWLLRSTMDWLENDRSAHS
jgi:hypothetical protein